MTGSVIPKSSLQIEVDFAIPLVERLKLALSPSMGVIQGCFESCHQICETPDQTIDKFHDGFPDRSQRPILRRLFRFRGSASVRRQLGVL